jgi:hypothetical protein
MKVKAFLQNSQSNEVRLMETLLSIIVCSVVVVFLAGCGSGSSSASSTNNTTIPSGVYVGTGSLVVSNSATGDPPVMVGFINASGGYMFVSEPDSDFINEVNFGSGTVSNGIFTSTHCCPN